MDANDVSAATDVLSHSSSSVSSYTSECTYIPLPLPLLPHLLHYKKLGCRRETARCWILA